MVAKLGGHLPNPHLVLRGLPDRFRQNALRDEIRSRFKPSCFVSFIKRNSFCRFSLEPGRPLTAEPDGPRERQHDLECFMQVVGDSKREAIETVGNEIVSPEVGQIAGIGKTC